MPEVPLYPLAHFSAPHSLKQVAGDERLRDLSLNKRCSNLSISPGKQVEVPEDCDDRMLRKRHIDGDSRELLPLDITSPPVSASQSGMIYFLPSEAEETEDPPLKRRLTLKGPAFSMDDSRPVTANPPSAPECMPPPILEPTSEDVYQQLLQPLPSPSASPIQSGVESMSFEQTSSELIHIPSSANEFIHLMANLSLSLLSKGAQNNLIFHMLQRTNRTDLSAFVTILKASLKRDLVAGFPEEVTLKILGLLDHRSLCSASLVCEKWRQLVTKKATADTLWKRLLFSNGFVKHQSEIDAEFAHASQLLTEWGSGQPENLYRLLYKKRQLIHRRWMDPHYQPKRISFPGHSIHVVTCLQYDDRKIISGADDRMINVYSTDNGRLMQALKGHDGGVWALKYIGNTLVSGSTDRTVRIWNIKQGKCTHVFRGHTSTVRCLDILQPTQVGVNAEGLPIIFPPQPLLVTGSRDNTLHVWNLPLTEEDDELPEHPIDVTEHENPYFIKALTGHTSSVRAIAGHGTTVVSGSYDHTIRVWDLVTGVCKFVLRGHSDRIYSTVLDTKRNRCISGSMDATVRIWDLETGECLYVLEGHSSLVGLLELSDDTLVSAAADSSLRVWNPDNGACDVLLRGHSGAITCFQHDEHKVVSGSERMLKLFDIKTGEFVRDLLTDITGGIWQVRFDYRRCVAAVQRKLLDSEVEETVIEILDFSEPINKEDHTDVESEGDQVLYDERPETSQTIATLQLLPASEISDFEMR
ncbi:hypothetical protein BABINDRAFT_159004 [Babjeviella inositovora NRRL Y-12698]|uniref:F-box domain-containing protein n=1 Tax=Babjeviella inositovora NRRL Y-12698 TaxID=984486 RepID=A0A1E3QXR0_9ASCO|nr:uncharacterized protein BABINDRAFT_159004 [Babjeviella inositovora NRRL Y-12698]ODQ82401.1 hypothetical protein BABINDRAFT_159004 [Babjeviella inositovora NRRL Y-12698]